MRQVLPGILILLLSMACQNKFDPALVVGTYETCGVFMGSRQLILDADGKFHYEESYSDCFGGESTNSFDGNYVIRNSYLVFRPLRISEQSYQWGSPLSVGRELISDTSFVISTMPEYPRMDDSVAIVAWDRRIFLLGINGQISSYDGVYFKPEIIGFINKVNQEFMTSEKGRTHINQTYWNIPCETCPATTLKDALPATFRQQLLEHTIRATITSIQPVLLTTNDSRQEVYVDAGSTAGVRIGMTLCALREGDEGGIEIDDVSDDLSCGHLVVGNLKPGDEVTSSCVERTVSR